jgi:hypothetical protein
VSFAILVLFGPFTLEVIKTQRDVSWFRAGCSSASQTSHLTLNNSLPLDIFTFYDRIETP